MITAELAEVRELGDRDVQAILARNITGRIAFNLDGEIEIRPVSYVYADGSIYLVHSFHVGPDDPSDLLAVYRYDGVAVTAAIARGNVFGCQFHPEKSGPVGLGIIGEFLAC